jgi:hypothetical protein
MYRPTSGVQVSWPPARSFRVRTGSVLVTARVQILLSLDKAGTKNRFPDRA